MGQRLYDLIFHPYTIKQWAKEPKELGPEVTARIPVRNNHDGRYFDDEHQALPSDGYTNFFKKLLSNKNIEVSLKTDYFDARDAVSCGRTYFTGPIDNYFANQKWEKLEYRSLDFERRVVKDTDFFQPKAVVNHPSSQDNFTRIVEYKHLLNQSSPHTILFYEHSKDGGEPYYPVPNEKNKALYAKYQELALKESNVTFVGRLANYKYFNMDQAILNALELFDADNDRVYDNEESPTSVAFAKEAVNITNTFKPTNASDVDNNQGTEKMTETLLKGNDVVTIDRKSDASVEVESNESNGIVLTNLTETSDSDIDGTQDNVSSFKKDFYDVCIAGAGLSGAVIAEQYASQLNQSVLVMEKRDHIAGNCYDYIDDETNIRVSKYGAHLFHTKYDRVWDYVQQFSEWTKYEHEVCHRYMDDGSF